LSKNEPRVPIKLFLQKQKGYMKMAVLVLCKIFSFFNYRKPSPWSSLFFVWDDVLKTFSNLMLKFVLEHCRHGWLRLCLL